MNLASSHSQLLYFLLCFLFCLHFLSVLFCFLKLHIVPGMLENIQDLINPRILAGGYPAQHPTLRQALFPVVLGPTPMMSQLWKLYFYSFPMCGCFSAKTEGVVLLVRARASLGFWTLSTAAFCQSSLCCLLSTMTLACDCHMVWWHPSLFPCKRHLDQFQVSLGSIVTISLVCGSSTQWNSFSSLCTQAESLACQWLCGTRPNGFVKTVKADETPLMIHS